MCRAPISAPLTVHLQPQVQIVDVEKDATFQCMVSGHPINDIKWLHNGKAIARNSRVEVSFYFIAIDKCTRLVTRR